MAISAIDAAINVLNQLPAGGETSNENSVAFQDFLTQAINQAELASWDSQAFSDALLMGEVNNLHDVTIAAREAELTLSLTVQIRDRLVEAYTELMRMQV